MDSIDYAQLLQSPDAFLQHLSDLEAAQAAKQQQIEKLERECGPLRVAVRTEEININQHQALLEAAISKQTVLRGDMVKQQQTRQALHQAQDARREQQICLLSEWREIMSDLSNS